MAGSEVSELFIRGQEASANGIKAMWQTDCDTETEISESDAEVAALDKRKGQLRSAAFRCLDMAKAAEKVGNQDKYEQFMARYEALIEEAKAYDEEIANVKSESY